MNPLITHPILAVSYTSLLIVCHVPALVAGILVAVFFYGREAGQQEHALKRTGVGEVNAYLGATFLFGWTRANFAEAALPALAALAWALTFLYFLNA